MAVDVAHEFDPKEVQFLSWLKLLLGDITLQMTKTLVQGILAFKHCPTLCLIVTSKQLTGSLVQLMHSI